MFIYFQRGIIYRRIGRKGLMRRAKNAVNCPICGNYGYALMFTYRPHYVMVYHRYIEDLDTKRVEGHSIGAGEIKYKLDKIRQEVVSLWHVINIMEQSDGMRDKLLKINRDLNVVEVSQMVFDIENLLRQINLKIKSIFGGGRAEGGR